MLLPFIKDEDLILATKKIIDTMLKAGKTAEAKLYSNSIDPFSAMFDSIFHKLSLEEWLEREKERQIQKTFQNTIGEFHQAILGAIDGWENLGTGNIVDIKNDNKKIVAEVKNKHNTTKGNHRVAVYDDLEAAIGKKEYKGYTGYFVEIIPKNKKNYNKAFTPSDNKTKTIRPKNEKIRIISGQAFYELASGDKDALKKLYMVLPSVISKVSGISPKKGKLTFEHLFDKTY